MGRPASEEGSKDADSMGICLRWSNWRCYYNMPCISGRHLLTPNLSFKISSE